MPIITAVEPQRRKGRLNIFVEGKFVIGVGESVAADLGLRVGREITPERLREIAGLKRCIRRPKRRSGCWKSERARFDCSY